jgi:hypothetical protein
MSEASQNLYENVRDQDIQDNCKYAITNECFESNSKWWYTGTKTTNQNYDKFQIQEINAFHVHNFLFT